MYSEYEIKMMMMMIPLCNHKTLVDFVIGKSILLSDSEMRKCPNANCNAGRCAVMYLNIINIFWHLSNS